MNLDRQQLLACTPEEAADLLREQGFTLRGANLKKSSWLLIANGLHVQRIADILFQRLEAARTREDALRVLRIARKSVRTRKSSKGARSNSPKENLLDIVEETSPARFAEDEMYMQWDQEMEEGIWPRWNYEEWLEEQASINLAGRVRLPGLLPASMLQDAIDRYAWDHRPLELARREDLRSRLDEDTYYRLLALTHHTPGLGLTDTELEFLRANQLTDLMRFVEQPQEPFEPAPVRDGFALAGLRLLEDHIGPKGHPFRVDWEAAASWLGQHLACKPKPELVPVIIACAYAFFRGGPAPLLGRLIKQSGDWHASWTSLLWFAYPRSAELLPERAAQPVELHGWWGTSGAYVNDIPWERVLDSGIGSQLVLHNLRKNVEDLFHKPDLMKDHHWNGARKLLLAGGGTLRRMDYPGFTVVCRPSISLLRLETFTELTSLAEELIDLGEWVNMLNRENLEAWIARVYEVLSDILLQKTIFKTIAETLEKHAIAYLVLRERVLRETYQAAPFRLRRKHIQRFWADQERGEIAFPVPVDLAALAADFGHEAVKEALAHALLDHFKDDHELSEEAAHPLKESLLFMLRSISITYHMDVPWRLALGYQPAEEDLEQSQEVANFLIQQTGNAPLELAQTLLINPQQGLPLMTGGRVTDLEQRCRRLVKAIAGVSQKKVSDGTARIFTLQPIPKSEALDRGDLGGDCSSGSVPMRALSPHHTYYGVFENGEQQRGYITVYEAGAEIESEEGSGAQVPVLCLETINVPIRTFDAVLQDLLVIFEAVAKSRGLTGGLVLITSLGTWNYQNGEVLRQSRRFRQGRNVRLYPADPAGWNVYLKLAPEAQRYTAFFDDKNAPRYTGYFRLLAPFQPNLDPVEPENISEARRIAALPPKQLRLIARGKKGPAGFISELPEIL